MITFDAMMPRRQRSFDAAFRAIAQECCARREARLQTLNDHHDAYTLPLLMRYALRTRRRARRDARHMSFDAREKRVQC